jgi:hypothetical protein
MSQQYFAEPQAETTAVACNQCAFFDHNGSWGHQPPALIPQAIAASSAALSTPVCAPEIILNTLLLLTYARLDTSTTPTPETEIKAF